MAKHKGKGKRRFNLRRVRLNGTVSGGTLAAKTLVSSDLIVASTDTYRLVSAKSFWEVHGLAGGDGPLLCGYARGGYSDAEIEQAIEAANIDRGTLAKQEQANRYVREVGIIGESEALNDGKEVKTRLNWLIPIGEPVKMWIYNLSGAALTTGSATTCFGNCFVHDE